MTSTRYNASFQFVDKVASQKYRSTKARVPKYPLINSLEGKISHKTEKITHKTKNRMFILQLLKNILIGSKLSPVSAPRCSRSPPIFVIENIYHSLNF